MSKKGGLKYIPKVLLRNTKFSYSFRALRSSLSLLIRIDWLRERESQFYSLFYDILQNDEERELIKDMLTKVRYVDDDETRNCYRLIADVIKNKWKCEENKSLVVVAKEDDKSDGGDVLVYGLRNCLGWKDPRFRSSLNSFEAGLFPGVDNVIVADDFTGTGQRLSGMLKTIKNKHPDITVRFVSICLMESVAREKYPDILAYQYYAPILLEPGMDHSRDPRVKTMKQIEEYLSPKCGNLSLDKYRLGYKESGALYWNRQYRVPNNVYPIFWWKKRRDGTDIDPIMDYY